jgi:hypothetical protein
MRAKSLIARLVIIPMLATRASAPRAQDAFVILTGQLGPADARANLLTIC